MSKNRTLIATVNSTPNELLTELKTRLVEFKNIQHTGDEQAGRVHGRHTIFKIDATYRMMVTSSGTEVTITVDKAPAPWKLIEQMIANEAKKWG